MKAWTLGILLVLTLGLGAYIYFDIQKPAERAEQELPPEERIFPYAWSEVKAIEIEIPGQEPLHLKEENSKWLIERPFQDIPSKTKLESFFTNVQGMKKQKLIFGPDEIQAESLRTLNLQAPEALVLRFLLKSKEEAYEISLGSPNLAKDSNYVLINSPQEVYLSSRILDSLRTERPSDFREKRLLTVESPDFAEIEITNSHGKMKFSRKNNLWEMIEPKNLPIDPSFADSQLSKIGLLRANDFLDKAPPALNKPDIQILIGFKEDVRDLRSNESDPRPAGSLVEMARVKKKSSEAEDPADQYDYYAKSEKVGPVAISRFHYDNASKSYKDFVKRSFDDFITEDVQEILVQQGDQKTLITKQASGFSWEQESKLNPEALEQALASIRNLRADKFIDTESAPSQTDLRIELKLASGKNLKFSLQRAKENTFWWVENAERSLKYSLRAESFDSNLWTEQALSEQIPVNEAEPEKNKHERN